MISPARRAAIVILAMAASAAAPIAPRAQRAVLESMIQRPIATDYILGLFQGPPASERDYAALRVATALLGSRMHSEIREEHGLS